MEEMYFNDGWMDTDLSTHALAAAIEICNGYCEGDMTLVESTTGFLAHFMSCWYQAILDDHGALVQPAVKTIAWFVQHMVDEHEMQPMNIIACASMLTRFTSLVITKSGGKLL